MSPSGWLLDAINTLVMGYFVALNAVYLATTTLAFRALQRYTRRLRVFPTKDLIAAAGAPPVTVVAPAYNESTTCVVAVHAMLSLEYPTFEVLVVNDGSKDDTLARLTQAFDLVAAERMPTAAIETAPVRGIYRSRRDPRLWVLDKENGGKADALNAALSFCQTPLYCAMDADTILERDAVARIVRPFLEDASTVAVGGIIRVVNGCRVRNGMLAEVGLPKSFLARVQVLEYLRAFLVGRMGWDALGATLVISGAFGIFHRATVIAAGAYVRDTVGEDMELVLRLHRYCRRQGSPYRIAFVPDPVAWTECPEQLAVLARQRDRWQRGLIDSLLRHMPLLLNPRFGFVGLVAFPYFFFLEMLGPVIETIGLGAFVLSIGTGRASPLFIGAFLSLALVFGLSLSFGALALEELTFRRYPRLRDILGLFSIAFFENIGYRQLCQYWRVRGVVSWLLGQKSWGTMTRRGFATGPRP